jgi:Sulfotransferase family
VDVDGLLAEVATEVRLDDYGDPTFRPGLDALWASAVGEADLNEIGMLAVEAQVRGNLANRLRVHEWHRTHPELAASPVEAPLILVGMPRSGTTALSHLLAADPDNRSLLAWEANESIPPPTRATYQDDPRFVAARAAPSAVTLINPEFKAIHHDEPDDAMECTVVHAQHFQSLIYSTTFNLPGYDEWLLASDWDGAARYHRLVLQVLQSECPGRWQLKSPQYGLLLDSVFATYPDARMIVTHRDPVKIAASTFSLLRSLTGTFSDVDHTEYIVHHWPDTLSALLDRAMDARDRIGEDSFFDVAYADIVEDPVAVVGTIYERFGIAWNPEKEAYFRRFHAANPQHKYGTHTYSLAEVGVERAPLDARFERYSQRYDVPREEA